MSLICCPLLVESPEDLAACLQRAERARVAGAHLVEWRIDTLAEDHEAEVFSVLEQLLKNSPLPGIITCRSAREGGGFHGEDADRVALLERVGLADEPPRYIDFELADYDRSANLRQKINLVVGHDEQVRTVETGLILSAHDFDSRPKNLINQVSAMAEYQACSIAKVAWHARSLRDCLEAFDLLRERAQPTIALCMGEFGEMTRILAPKFGGFLSFAALEEDNETAPGQLTIDAMRNVFRFDAIKSDTRVFGIMGWPVAQSWSPWVHNAGFDSIDFNGVYVRFPVAPGWEPFKASLGAMLDYAPLHFSGMSVTMPHKQHLVRFVREAGGELDDIAEVSGAANTLVVGDDQRLRAINTDAPAAVGTLAMAMGIEPAQFEGKRIAVLGAGGVARGVVAGLCQLGADVRVVNRTTSRADEFVAAIRAAMKDATIATATQDELAKESFDALVNCTSVGSAAGDDQNESPLAESVSLSEDTAVLDTVYADNETPLLRRARAAGSPTANGRDMFIAQAALQFELFTGEFPGAGLFASTLPN